MRAQKRCSRKILQTILAALFFSFLVAETSWAVPGRLNFQGTLTDSAGNYLDDGSYSIIFSLYDAPSEGIANWTETHTVVLQHGVFSVELGKTNPISASIVNSNSYLGLTVENDTEMTPRQPLLTVAYAWVAASADTLGGQPVSVFVQKGISEVITSDMISDESITANDIAVAAVGTSELIDGSVTANKLDDGSGSGVDADLLDGHDTGYFATETVFLSRPVPAPPHSGFRTVPAYRQTWRS